MVERAFVLINTNEQIEYNLISDDLKTLDGISEAYKVFGIYDIAVKVEAETIEKLRVAITYRLKTTRSIKSTVTMMAIKS